MTPADLTPAARHAIELLRGRHPDLHMGEPEPAEDCCCKVTSACARVAARIQSDGQTWVADTRTVSFRWFAPTGVEYAT